jgi:hypothetical protein
MPISDRAMATARVKSASASRGESACNWDEDLKVYLVPDGAGRWARWAVPEGAILRRCSAGSIPMGTIC